MNKIEVILKQWQNYSGWKCASTIDNIEREEGVSLEEQCEEYAKEYFSNLQIEEDEDFQIMFTYKDEIAKSYFASYYDENLEVPF